MLGIPYSVFIRFLSRYPNKSVIFLRSEMGDEVFDYITTNFGVGLDTSNSLRFCVNNLGLLISKGAVSREDAYFNEGAFLLSFEPYKIGKDEILNFIPKTAPISFKRI